MKAVKGILIFLGIIILLFLVVSFILPREMDLNTSVTVNSPVESAFVQINTPSLWKTWSVWDMKDPNMESSFSGPESGKGAKHSWKSEHPEVGNGSMEITESIPNQKVQFSFDFDGQGGAVAVYTFEEKDGMTTVTSNFKSEMPMIIGPWLLMAFEGEMMNNMQESMENLKKNAEAMPQKNTAKVEVTETMLDEQPALSIMDSCTLDQLSAKLGELYGEINKLLGPDAEEMMAGMPYAVYHKWDPEGMIHLEAGIPVIDEFENKGRVKYTSMPSGKMVMAVHMGAYSESGNTHGAIDEYLEAHNKEVIGGPMEIYANDPMSEPDTSKWRTEIYYPVK